MHDVSRCATPHIEGEPAFMLRVGSTPDPLIHLLRPDTTSRENGDRLAEIDSYRLKHKLCDSLEIRLEVRWYFIPCVVARATDDLSDR